MISRNVINPLLFCLCLLCASLPPARAQSATDTAATDNADKPLLIIRFNQKRVFFSDALNEAVQNVEKIVPEGKYVIASYVPPLQANRHLDQDDRIAAEQLARIQAVIHELQTLGITASRMSATNQVSNDVSVQEIHLFIK